VKYLFALIIALLLCGNAQAQAATHSVTLTWVDGKNPFGVTYTVYRTVGLCSGTPTFSKLATGITVLTYSDTTVIPGPYCYTATATVAGVESAQAIPVQVTVPAFAPTALAATVQ
jgi:hypothetical protein